MTFDGQFLFFFSALGAFNGLLLSTYFFFFAKPKKLADLFLGGLLLALSIRIWKSVFYYFSDGLLEIYLQIGLSACFLIGPFLYFYLQTTRKSSNRLGRIEIIHLSLLFGVILTVGILYPYSEYPQFWNDYFFKIIYYQWLVYVVASSFLLKDTFKNLLKGNPLNNDNIRMLNIFAGNFIICLAHFSAPYTSYIVGALSFSFVLYINLLLFLSRKKSTVNAPVKVKKYADKKINESEAGRLHEKLNTCMNVDKLYKDPNLSLAQLAKKLEIPPHRLSQFLNDNLDKSFSHFINEYRIEEARKQLESGSPLKMEVIAELAGFNSNSTFYTAFKKITGTTPAQYLKQQETLPDL